MPLFQARPTCGPLFPSLRPGQAASVTALSEVRPTPLAEEQWEALGRRLTKLERLVEAVPQVRECYVTFEMSGTWVCTRCRGLNRCGRRCCELVWRAGQVWEALGKCLARPERFK